jgi:hypothetical protein
MNLDRDVDEDEDNIQILLKEIDWFKIGFNVRFCDDSYERNSSIIAEPFLISWINIYCSSEIVELIS